MREKVRFMSGGDECVAWFYPGMNGACVVMAGGFAVTKEPGTDAFAARFNAAGYAVLAFDYRRLGESGGSPRQVVRIRDQIADWQAAIAFARTQPGVDPRRIAVWGFSATGGLLFRVAARDPDLAAAVAQTPNADGPAASRNAARYQTPGALLRFSGRALLDAAGALLGRPPRLVPLVGPPGTVALLTTPDAQDTDRALAAAEHPDWQPVVAVRSALRLGWFCPGRSARFVGVPLLVLVCDDDRSALAEPAVRAASQAPRGELVRLPGGHYAPFLEAHEAAVAAELDFLDRHLVRSASAPLVGA